MKFKKKAVAFMAGIMTAMSCGTMPSMAANTQRFLLGDVNGDGVVSVSDSIITNQYILGCFVASGEELTCMDVNQDYVIDNTDVLMIRYIAAGLISADTVTKVPYTSPNYETREYYRHDCNSSNTNKTLYTLTDLPQTANINEVAEFSYTSDNRDKENTNVVQLDLGNSTGSGFIVAPHVIATAAHCVYDVDEKAFINDISVNIYNKDGEVSSDNLVHTCKARYIHIPKRYIEKVFEYDDVYCDYALIYVEDDLSEYGVWSMGVSVDDFMETGKNLTASGFTAVNKTDYARYYSEGNVRSFEECNEYDKNIDYRISAESLSYGGKSGGVLYYKSSYDNIMTSSAVGIITGGAYSTHYTWAVRITPTILQFYKQNTNLTN